MIYHFHQKERKSKNVMSLFVTYMTKKTENYVFHIKALKQALKHGVMLKKVHRVIRKAWLEPYIDMNTKLRTEAKHHFEKDFFKLINNAAFGKTVENSRARANTKKS